MKGFSLTELRILAKRWEDSGRVVFHYPRLKMYAFNGGKRMTYSESLAKLREFFNK